MTIFLIGIVGVIIVSLISLFVPSFYSYNWGFANFVGVIGDASRAETTKIYYSLADNFGALAYFIVGFVIACLILYTVLMLTKNSNLIPLPLIFLLAIVPIIMMVISAVQSRVEGKYIKVGSLVVGAGKDAGVSAWGVICFILLVVFYCLIAKGFSLVREKINDKPEKGVKVIKTKENTSKKHSDTDFSL